ncbi:hypothetical protein LQ564_22100 [Massilia sp. G4R7]|uniref:Secreted protein n=1 Tax=Massilia phyllostachyos TaxID=2898585 RepID=A0ABS8QB63_9BURK|nr:hypothetical protein [Massilia phyllostachyos]MCD2518998.1 hypothetical protein [Massilia phyllostachyos]
MMSTSIAQRLFVLILAAVALPAASAPPTGGRRFGPTAALFVADLGQRSEADRQSGRAVGSKSISRGRMAKWFQAACARCVGSR